MFPFLENDLVQNLHGEQFDHVKMLKILMSK